MNKSLQTYLTTGEFAKLCKIKKQTLFHYDTIGLLKPEFKDEENGYRYYSTQQFEVFYVISILKDLRMPLNEIKNFIDNRCPSRLIVLLEEKIESMEKKIEELKQMQLVAKKKLNLTKSTIGLDTKNVIVKHCPCEHLITTDRIDYTTEKKLLYSIVEHISYCQKFGIYSAFFIGNILRRENVMSGQDQIILSFYTKLDPEDSKHSNFVKEEGLYAIAYHSGSYELTKATYSKLVEFINANSLMIKSDFYEETILDETSTIGYANYLTSISVKVE